MNGVLRSYGYAQVYTTCKDLWTGTSCIQDLHCLTNWGRWWFLKLITIIWGSYSVKLQWRKSATVQRVTSYCSYYRVLWGFIDIHHYSCQPHPRSSTFWTTFLSLKPKGPEPIEAYPAADQCAVAIWIYPVDMWVYQQKWWRCKHKLGFLRNLTWFNLSNMGMGQHTWYNTWGKKIHEQLLFWCEQQDTGFWSIATIWMCSQSNRYLNFSSKRSTSAAIVPIMGQWW